MSAPHTNDRPHGRSVTPWWYRGDATIPTSVLSWMDNALVDQGRVRVGPVEVTHVRPWSLVARTETDTGTAYLKAATPATAHEIAVLEVLHREMPGSVVAPLASDLERGLLLVPDGGPLLGSSDRRPGTSTVGWTESITAAGPSIPLSHTTPDTVAVSDPHSPPWELGLRRGLAGMAHLQRATAHTVPELLAAGVPDMRPERLVERFDEALDAAASRALGADSAWIRTQVAAVEEVRPQIEAEAAELGALSIGATVNHDDLHPWNLLRPTRPGRAPQAIDWGDAVISHPFSVLLVPLRARRHKDDGEPGVLELRRSYLGAWADAAPMFELRRAADLACRLGSIIRAHAWLRVLEAADAAQAAGMDTAGAVSGQPARRPTASSDLVPLLWLRNLALPSVLGVPTMQG